MSSDLVVVILAGGAGTRFWPASTKTRPKQFLPLAGERTLFEQTLERVRGLVPAERIYVVTSDDFVPLVQNSGLVPAENVLGEPSRKDTAAAVALSTIVVYRRFGDAVIATLTSDHVIAPIASFQRDVISAAQAARASATALYTFGIPPTSPSTAYGYLEIGDPLHGEGLPHYAVKRFVEKPDRARAEEFVRSGRFLWNSGMFVWRASSILNAFAQALPQHIELLSTHSPRDVWDRLQRVSIDIGVMEKATDVRCLKASFSWSDVGSFPALAEHLAEAPLENRARGRVAALDAHRNVVWCEDDTELVALLGVDDVIVVRAGKRTLVVPKSRAQEIKKLVESLSEDDT